jgi:hypothetical protein
LKNKNLVSFEPTAREADFEPMGHIVREMTIIFDRSIDRPRSLSKRLSIAVDN